MINNNMVNYLVEVRRLEHRSGTRKAIQFIVYEHFNIEENQAIINQGLGIEYILCELNALKSSSFFI